MMVIKMKRKKDMPDLESEEKHKILAPHNDTSQVPQAAELGLGELPLRDMDASLGRWLGVLAGKDIYKDIYPEEEWQVNLYRVGDIFGKLRIDLNRDGTWDEEWILRDDKVVRMVNPDNKGHFKGRFALEEYCWVKLP